MQIPETAQSLDEFKLGLASLTLADLVEITRALDAISTHSKKALALVQGELVKRHDAQIDDAYRRAGKAGGSVKIDLGHGFELKVEKSKTVKWDGEKLKALAAGMTWEQASNLFNISFSMPETAYQGLVATQNNMLPAVDAARTVKYGDPKVTLVAPEGADG